MMFAAAELVTAQLVTAELVTAALVTVPAFRLSLPPFPKRDTP